MKIVDENRNFNDRISGIPILDYLMDKLDVFLTNVRYNGSGMHAEKKKKKFSLETIKSHQKKNLTLQTPQATVHSSLVADA